MQLNASSLFKALPRLAQFGDTTELVATPR